MFISHWVQDSHGPSISIEICEVRLPRSLFQCFLALMNHISASNRFYLKVSSFIIKNSTTQRVLECFIDSRIERTLQSFAMLCQNVVRRSTIGCSKASALRRFHSFLLQWCGLWIRFQPGNTGYRSYRLWTMQNLIRDEAALKNYCLLCQTMRWESVISSRRCACCSSSMLHCLKSLLQRRNECDASTLQCFNAAMLLYSDQWFHQQLTC